MLYIYKKAYVMPKEEIEEWKRVVLLEFPVRKVWYIFLTEDL